MNPYTRLLSLILLTAMVTASSNESFAQPTAELIAEGIINTDGDQYGPTLTSDGATLYYTERITRSQSERIMVSHLIDGEWSNPVVVSFSGDGYDKEPYLSPDGSKLFFASRRRVRNKDRNFDLWFVERDGDDWGEPRNLTEVNSAKYDNYPAVAANGNLYFSSTRESSGTENYGLYVARFVDGHFSEPEAITDINSPQTDADPFIDPDERFIIFSSTRPGGSGSGDLYISYNRDGKWAEAVNLGPKVNTDDYEYTPFVSADGKQLYCSRGWGDIYRIDWDALTLENTGK